jgi:hypothetical protein
MRNFIFLIAVLFCFVNCKGKNILPVLLKLPAKAGTLHLVDTVKGTAANKFMYRMHGKMTGTHASIIGYYGNSDNKNILYVSSFESVESAEKALIKMASKIKKGSAGFTPVTTEQINGILVYQTSGMGLKHFFYQSDRFLVWWQAEPDNADKTFQDIHTFKFGE